MADSFIQLSPDSTGKRVDTRTAPDGDHREVQVIGSPTTAEVAEADLANGLDVDVTRVQGSVAVTNAGLTALAGAIAGTEVQVDIVSGGSAGVQYTEDDAAPANPVGTALAMVRDDALSGQTTADGDIVAARSTDKGELYVKHVDAIPVTDNGGVLTVDGTVAVTNADLTAIAASTAIMDDWDESDRAKVNPIVGQAGVAAGAGAVAATVQRVTLASDDPAVAALQILDNIVAGSEAQVDIVAALPAGTNNIGDVDIASLPNEGQQTMANSISVAIASDQSTVPVSLAAGGTTQYAEDTAHSSGDLVTLAGVVQQTADAALSSDGDRSVMQVDASGWLKVNIKAGAGSGGTAMVDDAPFTPATTSGTPAFAFADETAPDSVDEGDAGALRMTLDRKLLTRVVGATDANRLDVDASGHAQVDIAAASVTVPVSAASLPLPTGASTLAEQQTQSTALAAIETAVELLDNAVSGSELQVDIVAALPAGTNNIGDVDVLSVIPGTGATNLGKAVDSVPGATDTGVVPLVVRDDALAALTPVDGDYTTLRVNSTGSLWTADVNGALVAATVQLLGSSTYVETVTSGIVGAAVRHDADTTLVNTTEEITALQVDANGRLKVEAFSGETLPVSLATLPALVAGSANIGDVDIASVAAGTVMEVVGDVAADAAVPANPVAIGGRASTAVPTAVSADGDAVFQWLNRNGLTLVSGIPGAGLNADPYTLLSETAQYTTTQTSAVLVAGGGSERIIVTSVQIQAGGTTAGTLQVYFGTGAYSRGTDEAIFDGEFAPSATLKPGIFMAPPGGFRAGALGDDILVTTSAAINPLTITVWYYILGV